MENHYNTSILEFVCETLNNSSRFSINSEAKDSELLEDLHSLDRMLPIFPYG